jgi:hypothetical protein
MYILDRSYSVRYGSDSAVSQQSSRERGPREILSFYTIIVLGEIPKKTMIGINLNPRPAITKAHLLYTLILSSYLALESDGYCKRWKHGYLVRNDDFFHITKKKKKFFPAVSRLDTKSEKYSTLALSHFFSNKNSIKRVFLIKNLDQFKNYISSLGLKVYLGILYYFTSN